MRSLARRLLVGAVQLLPWMEQMKQQLHFVLDRETKGAVKYSECDSNGVILPFGQYLVGSLYMRKDKISRPYAQAVKVELEML